MGRLARTTISAPSEDPLAAIAGTHLGVVLSSLRLIVNPARHPIGFRATLLAPLRPVEPALSAAADRD
jgi:hypothetical protein